PRERSRDDTEPAREARGRTRGRRASEPEPEPAFQDVEDELDDELDERPSRRKRRREGDAVAVAAPPPAYDDDFDDEDEAPPPRRAKGDEVGFDDDFLDDEDDFEGEGEGGYEDDFGEMAPAPQPLPWKPIALGAAVVALALGFFFRDSLFPGGDDGDETAAETDGDSEAEPEGDGDAKEAKAEGGDAKAEGEGQPVEPEAAEGGGEAATAGTAEGGAVAEPPKPAALDADTLAKLDEARKAYKAANGNAKKLDEVGTQLQEILAKAPDHPDALTLMAQVYLEREKMDEALAMANRCTAVAAESADCWLTIGVIQEIKGEKETARAAYQKYLDLSPEGHYAKEASAALKRIK
ncbi:MAG: hypothetical protein KC501_19775, partial [Myxococcales bacterium]|nr:hypothetical protein [Myxococcales bacterium]